MGNICSCIENDNNSSSIPYREINRDEEIVVHGYFMNNNSTIHTNITLDN